ncbi:DHA2 family multidrug resistance protein-like MFS transporter [Prauserella sediminis]|uniref:DHA2 family multidrug resistance protein-like MFS transporter n=1 Tax=Prauserella sediminis TaxID=577680 RepID=A0A839XTY1_9PSEU|nr:MFS transporter [Prauserella sediminis]MBB3664023.1 DHA2 family multidrug resistance protein-like MFS transporter [Prauserella sediminis]
MDRAGTRDWVALGVLVLPVLLISVDMTVLGFALPYLSEDLAPTGAEQLWIVDIYSFVLAGLLVLMGSVGDRIGRRRLLLAGAAVFGAASVLAAFAASPAMLIAARALLGVGGATLMPSTLSLIRTIFTDPAQRRLAIAVWGSGFSGGMALGPVAGGWLLEHFWWGSVFLVNVPVMVVLLVVGPLLLPEAADPAPGRFDLLSAALSLATVLPVVYGIKDLAKHGIGLAPLAAIGLGIAIGAAFVHRQRMLTDPMIDLQLLAKREFSVSIGTNMLGVFAMAGLLLLVPQYLQLVLGMPPLTAALWMLPMTAAGVAGSLLVTRLARHIPVPRLIGAGLLLAAVGFALVAVLGGGAGPGLVVSALVLVGFGVPLSEVLTNDLIVSTAPAERAGSAAAISETGFELGGALGTAVLGSVAMAIYHSGVPAGTPAAARETLGGAVAAAQQLPPAQAEALLDTAREAFVAGMRISAVAGTVLLVLTAVQAMVLLRRTRTDAAVPVSV